MSAAELAEVQRLERTCKLEDLAVANENDGFAYVGAALRSLQADLMADRVTIPSHVTHANLEKWAQGHIPAMWTEAVATKTPPN
jgi:hypothetical protein